MTGSTAFWLACWLGLTWGHEAKGQGVAPSAGNLKSAPVALDEWVAEDLEEPAEATQTQGEAKAPATATTPGSGSSTVPAPGSPTVPAPGSPTVPAPGSLPVALKAAPSPKPAPDKEAEARYREAVQTLEKSLDEKELLAALDLLRSGFPASRPTLQEGAKSRVLKARAFVLQVLGEKGNAEEDLETVVKGLSDAEIRVRLATVMAVRRLGPKGLEALTKYLPGEPVPNNRKMAVKTLQHWKLEESMKSLVSLLEKERDRGVRNFVVTALEVISGRKLGDKVEAWRGYLESRALEMQAAEILSKNKQAEVKP